MKEQYMTLVTQCNVAITMAEQSNDIDALLHAIELKFDALCAADSAEPEKGVESGGPFFIHEGMVSMTDGKITQDGFGLTSGVSPRA